MSETLVSAATVVLHSCGCGRSILLADTECTNCVAARLLTEIAQLRAELDRHTSLASKQAEMSHTLERIAIARHCTVVPS
jgi:hypothetical protein